MALVIALIINGILIPQHAYQITSGDCEEISQRRAV